MRFDGEIKQGRSMFSGSVTGNKIYKLGEGRGFNFLNFFFDRPTDRQTYRPTDRQTLWFIGKLHFQKYVSERADYFHENVSLFFFSFTVPRHPPPLLNIIGKLC